MNKYRIIDITNPAKPAYAGTFNGSDLNEAANHALNAGYLDTGGDYVIVNLDINSVAPGAFSVVERPSIVWTS